MLRGIQIYSYLFHFIFQLGSLSHFTSNYKTKKLPQLKLNHVKTNLFAQENMVLPYDVYVLQTNASVQRYKMSLSIYFMNKLHISIAHQTISLNSFN